jgi:pimeloyl-ACP methyl ester carboxylesterase
VEWKFVETRRRGHLGELRHGRAIQTKEHQMNIASSLLAGAAVLGATMFAGSASAAPARNVVLVHGAFADASGWLPVYERLTKKGFKVTMVQEPETSLAEDVEATRRILALQDGPVVLVGHSWGGQIITEAGVDTKVKSLVYVAAIVPDVGESTSSLHARMPPASKAVKEVSGGFLMIDPGQFRADFAADIPEAQASFMAYSQVLVAAASLDTPAKAAAWKDKPSYGIVAGADRTINPDLERWMYKRAGAKVTEVAGSSHVVMLSHPDKVVAVIEEAAGE